VTAQRKLTTPLAWFGMTLIGILPVIATGHESGDWILRAGATQVAPDESSSVVTTTATGPLAGTAAGVDDNIQVGLNLLYMWSDNIGIEILAATPFKHDLSVSGLSAYGFDTTDLGSTKHLPPTISLEYFFGTPDSRVRPYVGIGANYTTFFSESLSGQAKSELAARSLDLDDSIGVSWRAGVDWQFNEQWLLNASFWNIDIDTEASFDSALGKVTADVDIDPWVYMISLGYKF